MSESRLDLGELQSDHVSGPVPYAALVPPAEGKEGLLPLCLSLHGGGSSRQYLIDQKPFFDRLWATGRIPPMVIATASTGELSFYLDHPDGSERWETFITEAFPAHLRATYAVRSDRAGTLITGISMGGWGSLRIAFRRPDLFAAVAAMEPAIEPGLRHDQTSPRNRIFLLENGNPLLGPDRDPGFWEANTPTTRLVANVDAIRDSGLGIYLECGDDDLLNLHDGTEYMHRLLWDLDVSHEYHLVRGADHVGPSLAPRTEEAFVWMAKVLAEADDGNAAPHEFSSAGKAWLAWTAAGMQGAPPTEAFDLASTEAIAVLRAQFAPAREAAEKLDPNTERRLGRLPPID